MDDKTAAQGISRHFRREAKIMVALFLLIVFFGFAAAIVVPRLQS